MRIEKTLVAVEGIFWTAIASLVLIATSLLGGCDATNPMGPEVPESEAVSEATTVGELKSEEITVHEDGISNVHIVHMSGTPGAPSIVDQEDGDDLEIEIEADLEDDGLMVTVVADEGAIVSRDVIKLYYEGDDEEYFGKVRIPTGAYLEEIVLLVETDDLPDGDQVDLIVIIERDDEEVAFEETEVDLSDLNTSNGPVLEQVVAGEEGDEIVLTFSDDVDARRSIKDNVSVVIDRTSVRIRSYSENGDEVTLIMREDLIAGEYEVSYNGEGGLEGLDGEDVQEFSETLVIEDEGAWISVKVGILGSNGDAVAGTLTAQGVQMTTWAEGIIRDGVRPERRKEWIDLHALTEEDLGLTGDYTFEEVYDAGEDLGYRIVPEEAAVVASMLDGHKDGEHYLIMSDFLRYDGKDHLFVITREPVGHPVGNWIAAHRSTLGMKGRVWPGHTFVFTR